MCKPSAYSMLPPQKQPQKEAIRVFTIFSRSKLQRKEKRKTSGSQKKSRWRHRKSGNEAGRGAAKKEQIDIYYWWRRQRGWFLLLIKVQSNMVQACGHCHNMIEKTRRKNESAMRGQTANPNSTQNFQTKCQPLCNVDRVATHTACRHTATLLLFLKPTTAPVWEPIISSVFKGHTGSFCPQDGWCACQELISMLNGFLFAARVWFYVSENHFIWTPIFKTESQSCHGNGPAFILRFFKSGNSKAIYTTFKKDGFLIVIIKVNSSFKSLRHTSDSNPEV